MPAAHRELSLQLFWTLVKTRLPGPGGRQTWLPELSTLVGMSERPGLGPFVRGASPPCEAPTKACSGVHGASPNPGDGVAGGCTHNKGAADWLGDDQGDRRGKGSL